MLLHSFFISYLHLWCYEKTGDPNKLQHALFYVVLGQHEPVKVILCQVERLPVKSVRLTHLVKQVITLLLNAFFW